jgi:hypothetical protein
VVGQPIRMSGEVGIAEFPAPPPTTETAPSQSRYAVRVVMPDGTAVDEHYDLRIPRTSLRVLEPPPVLLSTAANIVVRGTCSRNARVRIGGIAATVTDTTFSAVVPLNPGSNALGVVAYAPDGAPSLANLAAYRGIQALIDRPPPERAHLRLTGTVVGAPRTSPEGTSVQFVVDHRQCPGGHCTAWVQLPPNARSTPGGVAEVVGEIHGVQTYSTQSGERRSDPVIQCVLFTPRR